VSVTITSTPRSSINTHDSLFSIDCAGNLYAGVIGKEEFYFKPLPPLNEIVVFGSPADTEDAGMKMKRKKFTGSGLMAVSVEEVKNAAANGGTG
jgi:hypothetical protein